MNGASTSSKGKSATNNRLQSESGTAVPIKTDPVTGEPYRNILPNGKPDTPTNRAQYLASTPGASLGPSPDGGSYIVSPPSQIATSQAEQDFNGSPLQQFGQYAPAVIGGVTMGPIGAAGGAYFGQYSGAGASQPSGPDSSTDPQSYYNPYQGPGAIRPPSSPAAAGGGSGAGDDTALRDKLLAERDKAGTYAPPPIVASAADRTAGDQIRAQQLQHIQDLRDQAAGRGPSQAGALLNQQLLDTNQNALGIGASGRGVDAGGGRRMALRSMSENARRNGLDAAVVRQKEMLDANAQLGTQLDTTRTADNTLATSDADRATRASEAAATAANTAHSTNVTERQGLLTGGLTAQQTESQSQARRDAAENTRKQLEFAYAQLANATTQAEKDRWTKVISGLVAAGATVLGAYAQGGGFSNNSGSSTSSGQVGMTANPITGDLAD